MTLSDWLDLWLTTYKKVSVRESTYENYLYAAALIKKYPLSRLDITDLKEHSLQKMLNALYEERYSKSTIRLVKITLSQSLEIAKRQEIIKKNPCKYLIMPDAPVKRVEALTFDEQTAVEQACAKVLFGDLMLFLLNTGLRRIELMQLKWEDYNPSTEEIYIRSSKTQS